MEKDFTRLEETLAEFKERRQRIKDNCQADLNRIQTEANEKKNLARAAAGAKLIELAKEQDEWMKGYREWRLQNQPDQPQE